MKIAANWNVIEAKCDTVSDLTLQNALRLLTRPKIIIDPEFSTLLPPLATYEYAGLEQLIVEYGCWSPLVLWAGHNILLDGHARFEICHRRRIPFETCTVEPRSRLEAKAWIMQNQLARHNFSIEQRREMAARIARELKAEGKTREQIVDELSGGLPPASLNHLLDKLYRKRVAAVAEVPAWT